MEQALRELFQKTFGEPAATVASLKGDGSGRKVLRLCGASRQAIGIIGPDPKENAAFLGFSRHFRRCGLPVPEIYAEDPRSGVYLEEDLGDTTLFQFLSKNRSGQKPSAETVAIYEKAVARLPQFQIVAGRTLDYGLCHPRPSFDRQSMMWDLNYFKYYFLRLAGIPFSEQELEDDFSKLVDFLLEAPRDSFLYRDFQSRNIMIRDGEPWFIDYQGGRRGALQYDIASLLVDAKADLPFALRRRLLERYLDAAQELAPLDREGFLKRYPGFAYVRIMQAMGAYGLRGFYERKAHFLQSIPYAIRNLEHLQRASPLPISVPALDGVFRRLVASSALRQFGEASLGLTVRVQSFSFREGLPVDDKGHGGGFVFDCRALPNPGRYPRYAKSTGRDPDTVEFLEKEESVQRFLRHACDIVDQSVENYQSRNFTSLTVSFGCTGGQHRSVFCAERLAAHLKQRYQVNVEVRHRGLEAALAR